MSTITCNLCGADDYAVTFEAGEAQAARIVTCKRCGLMYANPRADVPEYEQIEAFDPDFVENDPGLAERLRKESLQVCDFAKTRALLAERFPGRGRLLEVGSGYGYLLDYFRQDGWQVQGVEPNEGLNRNARTTLKLDVFPGILPQANLADATFDVVLMAHVIEHLPDPQDTLREIRRVLKPGGVLVMETPRYDTLMFKLLGKRERSVSCGGHVYFFTTRTLRESAEKAGFEVIREDKVGRSLTLERLAYNVGVITRSSRVRVGLNRLLQRIGLNDSAIHLNLRDMERIYCRKLSAA